LLNGRDASCGGFRFGKGKIGLLFTNIDNERNIGD